MAFNIIRRNIVKHFQSVCRTRNLVVQHKMDTISSRCYCIYEPDYLELNKSPFPLYDVLNIQIKGYDYPVLENYQKLVHKIAVNMDIEVEDGWATPPQHFRIQRYKPESTVVDSEYKLAIYERNVQVVDVPSTLMSIFLELLKTALPEGVTLQVHHHLPEHEDIRYVPDHDLATLKSQLESLGDSKKK